MIKRETFKTKMEEARDLLGSTMKLSAFDVMFDKVSRWYNEKDFIQAIDDLVQDGEKLIYPNLLKALNRYRDRRIEAELRTQKAKEAKEIAHLEKDRSKDLQTVKSIIADLKKRLEFNRGEFPELPYVKYNAVFVHSNGFREDCYIDHTEEGFENRMTIVHEQAGDAIVRRVVLDIEGLKIVSKNTERRAV